MKQNSIGSKHSLDMTSEGESQNSGAAVDRNQSETYIGIPNPHNYCLF